MITWIVTWIDFMPSQTPSQSPIQAQRAVDLIVEQLRSDILEGRYPIGSRLPAERKLSEQLQVNRLTLRAALSHLEAQGLILPRHGQGIVVLDYKETGNIELLAHMNNPEALQEMLSLRQLLAAEALAGATIHASLNDVNRLLSLLEKQQKQIRNDDFIMNDLRFFEVLVQSSQNLTLRLLFNSLKKITLAQPAITSQLLNNREQAIGSYQALISLIRSRQPVLAKKAILGYLSPSEQSELQAILSK